MKIALGILIVIAIIAAASVLTVAAVLGIRRSRQKHGSSGTLGVGVQEIQSLLEPSKRHVVVAARESEESTREDTSGEPPQ
jgi:negative regulator of sigma E activity